MVLHIPLHTVKHFHPVTPFFLEGCTYHLNKFCCLSVIISIIPILSLNSLYVTLSVNLTPHIHLIIPISSHWNANLYNLFANQVSQPHNVQLRTELLGNFLLIRNGIILSTLWVTTESIRSPVVHNIRPKAGNGLQNKHKPRHAYSFINDQCHQNKFGQQQQLPSEKMRCQHD